MKKQLTTIIALSALAFTACSHTTAPQSPAAAEPSATTAAYTWEAGPYPSDAPSLLSKEEPASRTGWFMGTEERSGTPINQWQTIYSYKDASDPRGATVAVVFYDDLERCVVGSGPNHASELFERWIMQDQRGLNSAALYEYVFSSEGRTFPHPNDAPDRPQSQMFVDESSSLRNIPSNYEGTKTDNPQVEDAKLYTLNASSTIGLEANNAIGQPGRTAEFYANLTSSSLGEQVPTGCATVYTALSNEAAATYDADKFKQAYEQATEFAKEIETMPQKIEQSS